ncbi:MAG: GNAT family N-acetyltransferase [Acidobacteriaceae bacterium]
MKLPEGSSFSIRPAVMRDLDALAAIDAICFPPGIAYPREEIAYLLLNPAIMVLVAERSSVIVGLAALERRRRTRQNARRGELVTIEVLPEFRRELIGCALYRRLEDSLLEWGGSSIRLHVSVDNAVAFSFYQRLGYRVVSRIPQYYLRKIDAWQMEKNLL